MNNLTEQYITRKIARTVAQHITKLKNLLIIINSLIEFKRLQFIIQ